MLNAFIYAYTPVTCYDIQMKYYREGLDWYCGNMSVEIWGLLVVTLITFILCWCAMITVIEDYEIMDTLGRGTF